MGVFELAKKSLNFFWKVIQSNEKLPKWKWISNFDHSVGFLSFFPFDLDFPQKSTIRSEAVTQREASGPGKMLILSFLSLIEELGTASISLDWRIGLLSLTS